MASLGRILLLTILLPLAACAESWLAVSAAPSVREPAGPREAVFCYRTLADVDCLSAIDRNRDGRLVGVYLRELDDPSSKLYWLERAHANGTGRVVVGDPLPPVPPSGPVPLMPASSGMGPTSQNPVEPPSDIPIRLNQSKP